MMPTERILAKLRQRLTGWEEILMEWETVSNVSSTASDQVIDAIARIQTYEDCIAIVLKIVEQEQRAPQHE
jgi:hypothetical protein